MEFLSSTKSRRFSATISRVHAFPRKQRSEESVVDFHFFNDLTDHFELDTLNVQSEIYSICSLE